ncbi:MAG: glycosyltransferase family 39 protein, partial [Deltaproteobacteria bacterium]|nr:glycosyltransferase family 39 protein [Deltaproteobacteria bacterium]
MSAIGFRIRHALGSLDRFEGFLVAVVFGLLVRQFYWVLTGYLNPDEFENLQIVWLFERGIWPYRDYIHTHLPVHNLLLWPIYRVHGPTAELPGLVRIYLFPITLLVAAQIGWIARQLANRRIAAWLAIIVFLASPAVGKKLAEVRPDAFAYPCWLAAIASFVSFTESKGSARSSFYWCAAALGIGLLFSQKGVLLVPALAIGFESQMAHFSRPPWTGRFYRHVAFAAIAAAPTILLLSGLFAMGMVSSTDLNPLFTGGLHSTSGGFFNAHRIQVLLNGALASFIAVAFGLVGIFRARLWKGAKNFETKVGVQALAFVALVSLAQFAAQSVMFYHVLVLPVAVFSILAAK